MIYIINLNVLCGMTRALCAMMLTLCREGCRLYSTMSPATNVSYIEANQNDYHTSFR